MNGPAADNNVDSVGGGRGLTVAVVQASVVVVAAAAPLPARANIRGTHCANETTDFAAIHAKRA